MSYLVAVDRHSGKLLWSRQAQWGFLNRSGVCAGGGKVYCVDLITEKIYNKFQEAGRKLPSVPPTLYALDLKSGSEVWSFPLDVYVQNIVYSDKHDLLLAPCRNLKEWRDGKWVDLSIDIRRGKRNKNAAGKNASPARQRRPRGLGSSRSRLPFAAHRAGRSDHRPLGHSYDLLTGKRHLRVSPLTGKEEWWSFRKGGCNHLIACQNMVTWRCAYYDLAGQSGVKKLTGMDAGCSPTLIPAGGILNVANFGTHHKRNRMTAMALVHRPDNPLWTAYSTSREKQPVPTETEWIQKAGFNFGAPGDRFDSAGTLCCKYPRVTVVTSPISPKRCVGTAAHRTARRLPLQASWAPRKFRFPLPPEASLLARRAGVTRSGFTSCAERWRRADAEHLAGGQGRDQ